jgi:hypothetical protein
LAERLHSDLRFDRDGYVRPHLPMIGRYSVHFDAGALPPGSRTRSGPPIMVGPYSPRQASRTLERSAAGGGLGACGSSRLRSSPFGTFPCSLILAQRLRTRIAHESIQIADTVTSKDSAGVSAVRHPLLRDGQEARSSNSRVPFARMVPEIAKSCGNRSVLHQVRRPSTFRSHSRIRSIAIALADID